MIRPLALSALGFLACLDTDVALAQGRTVQARDGDLIVVPQDATITIARALSGHIRVASHNDGRLLILLLDEGPQPDGIVDWSYRFELHQPPAVPLTFDGAGSLEEYDWVGQHRGGRAYGVVLPQGRVLLTSGGPAERVLPVEHTAALTFGRGGHGKVRAAFDHAEADAISGTTPGGVQMSVGLSATGVPGGVTGGVATSPGQQPVRVGGNIRQPAKIKDAVPITPDIARSARISGVVILEVTIDPQGKVRDVRVLRSIPLLDQAAVDAVRQWEYEPTTLNGVPVPVIMTVTVPFSVP